MKSPRGTHDLFDQDILRYRHIVNTAIEVCARYGFGEIKTPIFEFTNVFERTLGDTSDTVTKEMYTFLDRGGESITLRPEGTAPVVRALISEGLAQRLPIKFFYEGPMFRYERPQKGRYRQFYQIGVEHLGVDSPESDIESVALGYQLLKTLGVISQVKLEINSIGDQESRIAYRAALVDYLNSHKDSLSADSQRRLQLNPLRILDSKDAKDIQINENAPQFTQYLNETSKSKFDFIKSGLDALNIPYTINPKLVRGFDYYSHLVFEFRTNALGSQDAVLSGGRYDGLCETMGGPKTAAVGWGAGIERIGLLMSETPKIARPISLIPVGERAENACRKLAFDFRSQGLRIEMSYTGNMSNRMKKAVKHNSIAAVIVGDNELDSGVYSIKNLDSGEQTQINASDVSKKLLEFLS